MGWQDRPYSGYDPPGGPRPTIHWVWPPLTKWVRNLLIINFGVFALDLILRNGGSTFIPSAFSFHVYEATAGLQVWRWLTYQFVHGSARHIIWNMVGLYFFGPELERTFGTRRFLAFYLSCGAVGSLFYTVLVLATAAQDYGMVGASGAVLGLLAGCAVLFPRIMIFGIIPIRIVAVIFGLIYLLSTLDPASGQRLSDACHLGGMAAAVVWIRYLRRGSRWITRTQERVRQSAWKRKLRVLELERDQVDRILAKVHEHGMHSLTRAEKKILQRASERQRREEREIERGSRL